MHILLQSTPLKRAMLLCAIVIAATAFIHGASIESTPKGAAVEALRSKVIAFFQIKVMQVNSPSELKQQIARKYPIGTPRSEIVDFVTTRRSQSGLSYSSVIDRSGEILVDIKYRHHIEDGSRRVVGASIVFKFDDESRLVLIGYMEEYIQGDIKEEKN